MNLPYKGDFRITKLYGTKPPAGVTYSTGEHSGIDLVGVADKTIRAVKDGTVYRSSYDLNGWGKYVVIRQDDGMYAIYSHMSKSYKTAGQFVRAGDMLGIEGATGQATGSHLHFELRTNYNDKYSTVDPAPYLSIENKVGLAKVVDKEVLKTITITLCGKDKVVNASQIDGNNYVKLQDLRCSQIEIGYTNGKPTITVKK